MTLEVDNAARTPIDDGQTRVISRDQIRMTVREFIKEKRDHLETALANLDHNTPTIIGRPTNGSVNPNELKTEPSDLVSKKHLTITYDKKSRFYHIEDGSEGRPSSNGTYLQVPGGDKIDVNEILALFKKIDPSTGKLTETNFKTLSGSLKTAAETGDGSMLAKLFSNFERRDMEIIHALGKLRKDGIVINSQGLFLGAGAKLQLGQHSDVTLRLPRTENDAHRSAAFKRFQEKYRLNIPLEVRDDGSTGLVETPFGPAALVSDVGNSSKEENQDRALKLLTRKGLFLFACDGVSNSHGKIASERVVVSLADDLLYCDDIETAVNATSLRVNREFDDGLIHETGSRDILSTVVGAHITSKKIKFANLGDSQGVLIRDDEVVFATKHHSLQESVRQHLINEEKDALGVDKTLAIPAMKLEEIDTKANDSPNMITAAAGAVKEETLMQECTVTEHNLKIGDRVILATDGLWDYVDHKEAIAILNTIDRETGQKISADKAAEILRDTAIERMKQATEQYRAAHPGSDKKIGDNITVVVYEHKPEELSQYHIS